MMRPFGSKKPLRTLQQLVRWHAEGTGNFPEVVDRDILFGPLNGTQISSVKPGFGGKDFLRPTPLSPH